MTCLFISSARRKWSFKLLQKYTEQICCSTHSDEKYILLVKPILRTVLNQKLNEKLLYWGHLMFPLLYVEKMSAEFMHLLIILNKIQRLHSICTV